MTVFFSIFSYYETHNLEFFHPPLTMKTLSLSLSLK